MTEILTESFCERCGTRYTFETVAPRQKRLGGLKTLSRGLRTFVMSDDTTLDEAMASARSDEEREITGRQLDAFHKTFNFCMNCRQYTCSNCWNPVEARCLSCAPRADQVIGNAPLQLHTHAPLEAAPSVDELLLAAPEAIPVGELAEADIPSMDTADILGRLEIAPAADGEAARAAEARPVAAAEALAPTNGAKPDLEGVLAATAPVAEPTSAELATGVGEDGGAAALFEAAAEAQAAESAAAEVEPAEVEPAEVEPADVVAEAPPTAPPWLTSTDERARSASERTGGLLRRFRPGQSLDAEIAAYEASLAAPTEATAEEAPAPANVEPERVVKPEPVVEPELIAAAALEPQPVSAAAEVPPSEPVAAEDVAVEVEPEPVAAQSAAEPVAAEPEAAEPVAAEPKAPTPRRDVVEQPAWPAPEIPAAAPDGEPEWPTGPRWPTSVPARPAPPPLRPTVAPPAANVPPPFVTPIASGQPAAGDPVATDDALAFLTARRAGEAMWAASAQDVVAATGRPGEAAQLAVRSCVSCGLSLSATARFCRRCGARQDEV